MIDWQDLFKSKKAKRRDAMLVAVIAIVLGVVILFSIAHPIEEDSKPGDKCTSAFC